MSVVSFENGSDNVCADCKARLPKLKRIGSVSVVSLKNPSELWCIVLVTKFVKIMSVVSLKNPSELQCIILANKYVKIMSALSLKNLSELR